MGGWEEDGVGGEGRWAAGDGLNPVLRVPVIGPNMLRGLKRCLTTTGVNFRLMPSM